MGHVRSGKKGLCNPSAGLLGFGGVAKNVAVMVISSCRQSDSGTAKAAIVIRFLGLPVEFLTRDFNSPIQLSSNKGFEIALDLRTGVGGAVFKVEIEMTAGMPSK